MTKDVDTCDWCHTTREELAVLFCVLEGQEIRMCLGCIANRRLEGRTVITSTPTESAVLA